MYTPWTPNTIDGATFGINFDIIINMMIVRVLAINMNGSNECSFYFDDKLTS